ncbi:MAG: peptidoglycan DD-metalloendopeptidase family protein [Candidatus Sericytochromatia bacterium]|nr:peptidoglycan DD-metalloendopeptidase family protein [Candidatus Sericytochromatia bacterium]
MRSPLLRPWVMALLLCAGLLPAVTPPAVARGSLTEDERALQSRQRRLNEKLAAHRARVQMLRKKEFHAVRELSTLQQKLEQTSTELQDSQFRLRRAEYKLSLTADQLSRARSAFSRQQLAAGARLRAIYKTRAMDGWQALLTSPDMTTFLTRYHYFKRISAHDAAILENMERNRQLIHQQQRQFAQQRQNIARVTEVIGSQKIQLSDLAGDQRSLVDRIKSERQAAEQVVAQLEQDNASIASMIQRIIARRRAMELAARRNNAKWVRPFMGTGRFMWPVAGVVTSGFGPRMHPILGRYISHHGIDFGAPSGAPIYAVDNGEVIYAGWYGGYGKVVIMDHGGDITTLFGHASSYSVGVGQRVRKGQVIAYVGSTGMSTGPHLHFEVRRNGAAINPMAFLR